MMKEDKKGLTSLKDIGDALECPSLWKSTAWMPNREKEGGQIWQFSENWDGGSEKLIYWMNLHEERSIQNVSQFIIEFALVCNAIEESSERSEYRNSRRPSSLEEVADGLTFQEWLDVFIIWQSLCKRCDELVIFLQDS